MPELPEVETVARTLSPLIEGKSITGYTIYNPSSLQGEHSLDEALFCSIGKVFRRGKLLLLPLHENQPLRYLCFHLKMTGRIFVYPQDYRANPHTRISLSLHSGEQIFFDDTRKFGYVRLLYEDSIDTWPFWHYLGPEPLDIDSSIFIERVKGKKAKIKTVLLDQQVIAGCGNIYADESLFAARIHPATPTYLLKEVQLQELHTSLVTILTQAIRECGSSIKDYRTARGDVGSFQNYFRVYGRTGKACFSCNTILQSLKVAGRTSAYCPQCQPLVIS